MLKIKRIYENPDITDGFRVLVDRLWPRGVSKQQADIDLWLKDVAPSTSLRQWFGHEPDKFLEFSARYKEELAANSLVDILKQHLDANPNLTLIYAAKNPVINHAIVLKQFLENGSA